MKKINPENKICIYLDQFVISDIIDGTNPLWIKIKGLLELNYTEGKIYCPLSVEHTLETAKKKLKGAIKHDIYYKSISDNYLLKTEPFLTSQLISSLIRKNNLTLKTFLKSEKFRSFEKIYNEINKNNNIYNESITHKVSSQNSVRKILSHTKDIKDEQVLINAIKNIEIDKFISRLKDYLKNENIIIRPDNYGKHNFPNWIDQLLYQLTNKHQFKKKEFKNLLNELERNGYSRIPTLHTRVSLIAYLAIKNKQENTGDHIDIMRISSYLFSTDIFFTDKKRKHEICDLKLDKKYNTKVYSGVKQDLVEFICYLENI
ncbi:hypothetical protein [uncultured Aquimarina sp.]|uniref:hypothetical protein n=1 Tax=uncultured Aquimarina sp. TaxID=575652 RepID=UPI00260F4EE5|nr:hypothetical protein [uncultured Aquimarina sp.]